MGLLWTPPSARTLPRAELPAPDQITLADRRILARVDRWPPPTYHGWRYQQVRKNGKEVPKGLRVIASVDPHPEYGPLLHVSLSFPNRLPTWEDIKQVRAAFYSPNIDCMMVLPRAEHYVNLHSFVFHIWQCPQGWGMM